MYINYCYTTAQPEATNTKQSMLMKAREEHTLGQDRKDTTSAGMFYAAKFYDFSIKYGNLEVLLVRETGNKILFRFLDLCLDFILNNKKASPAVSCSMLSNLTGFARFE